MDERRLFALSAPVLCLLAGGFSGAASQVPAETYVQAIPGTEVSFAMGFVPGGTFRLGSPPDQIGRDADEGPQRTVTLDPFWIGVHEVTNDEYSLFRHRHLDDGTTADPNRRMDVEAVSRPSPPYEDPSHGMSDGDRPATGMTQWAALQYARWLSEKTGRLYRLPTEAEWEYACRAGAQDAAARPTDSLNAVAWYVDNSGEVSHPVGTKSANGWGLHDLLGNVAEWTMDFYDPAFYATLPDSGHAPWARSDEEHPRTVRGGAFDDDGADLRCADRLPSTMDWKRRDPQLPRSRWWNTDSPHVGFRLSSPVTPLSLDEIRAYWTDVLGS